MNASGRRWGRDLLRGHFIGKSIQILQNSGLGLLMSTFCSKSRPRNDVAGARLSSGQLTVTLLANKLLNAGREGVTGRESGSAKSWNFSVCFIVVSVASGPDERLGCGSHCEGLSLPCTPGHPPDAVPEFQKASCLISFYLEDRHV